MNEPKYTVEQLAAAIEEHHGNIAAVARHFGERRSKLKERIDRSPFLISLLNDLNEEIKDIAQGNIRAAVIAGDPAASRFVLMTIGKDRGYSTRVEQTGKDGAPLQQAPAVLFRQITDDEIAEAKALREGAIAEDDGLVDPDGDEIDDGPD